MEFEKEFITAYHKKTRKMIESLGSFHAYNFQKIISKD